MSAEHKNSPNIGRVTACFGRRGQLETASGKQLDYLAASRRHKPVCGDRVRFDVRGDDSPALLNGVLPRDSELARAGANWRTEVIAANFSLLAVVAAAEPLPDYELADRLICAAARSGTEALLVWNKIDLGRKRPARLREYERAGFEVLSVSALAGTRMRNLARRLKERVTVFAGQSGSGKSTLINALLRRKVAAAGNLSAGARQGRHTTASAAMHTLPNGARVMDLPGVRSLMPVLDNHADLLAGYPEFSPYAAECRFANCRHRKEPGCAVLAAVAAGRIPAGRYAGYLALLREFERKPPLA
ncbi:MAG: ribosome small subunit-dependent GTPase A [Gammaproteobacteria bacterium]|nr:ribosome small subunit-dependent GTPase A [Gammaproteobacteria bacterium]MCY4255312.1 ribosome small subunit-dependent GTPase A [Gammaproteobacteria bacterium]MCY4341629.1 ribosome small subunit-dependent GTPase A [Gammaproteobacteria bacterium]